MCECVCLCVYTHTTKIKKKKYWSPEYMPILNPTQEPRPALGFYDPRLYEDRSEGRKKRK